MSSYDPSSADPEGGGKPSFEKQPPTPADNPSAPPPPPANGSPYDPQAPHDSTRANGTGPGGYQGSYGGSPYDQPPGQGAPYGQQPYGGDPYGSGAPAGGPTAGMPPLGTWPSRILARVIDYVIIQVIAFVLVLPFTGFGNRDGWTGGVWLFYVMYLIYEGVMLSRDGQTVGKKVMNVRVATLADGSRPSTSAAWTRAAVYTLPAVLCCGLWWLVNGLFGVFDKPYRQCIHDKAAKTVVVSTN
ncbi:RDD family protein [Kitasatospora sp. NPDC006697]|uniref:RDD family protein n=1 Tax=Kitasatospora sp. NPDC006697 TaxID=3364020 RepID=UPI003677DDAA